MSSTSIIVIFLVLSSILFAQAPDTKQTSSDNIKLGKTLEGYYNSSIAQNDSLIIKIGQTKQNLSISLSVDIAGLSMIADNSTYPVDGLSLIIARGYKQDHLVALPSEGYSDFFCDQDFFQNITDEVAWRCDFDLDDCVEFENSTPVIYDVNVLFTFNNHSVKTPLYSNIIQVPQEILDGMHNSSGLDTLNVSLDGNVTFLYTINDRGFSYGECSNYYNNFSKSFPISISRSFKVAGENRLFFLRSPVLGEQWFKNNRFNTIVLSQSPLYYAEISLDSKQQTLNLRDFFTTKNAYGLKEVFSVSNWTSTDQWSEKINLTNPTPLEHENLSFSYIYEFNYSYPGLVGWHNLSILVNDIRGSDHYNASLLSRFLSYNSSVSENRTPLDSLSRKSAPFTYDNLNIVHLSLGIIGLILLIPIVLQFKLL